jgi:arabinogalactan oligomer/maltooligosaccharide transport system substrate-binding protein
VYAGTTHATAAEQFVRFMTSATSESTTALKLGTLPARTAAYTAEVTKNQVIASFRPAMAIARPRIALPQASDLLGPLAQDYVKILQGEPAQAGLDNSAKEFAKLLPGWAAP